jgi:hypothetical protein
MSAALDVALISAAVALVTALLSVYATQSIPKLQARLKGKETVSRYRNPILYAAYDLQCRIYNIVQGDLLKLLEGDEREQNYLVNSTLFVIAQYLAWAEAIRRGVQYLDLGKKGKTRELVDLLEEIRHWFSTQHKITEPPFRIYRADQRAIGELMLQGRLDNQSGSMLWRCRGYAYFCTKLDEDKDQGFARQFAMLKSDVRNFAEDKETARARLIALQHALIDLIDLLDPPKQSICIPGNSRSKISLEQNSGASLRNLV